MKKISTVILVLVFLITAGWAVTPPAPASMVFYNGGVPDSMYLWPWGFVTDPVEVPGSGYTPGNNALKWATSADDGWQGEFIGLNSNVGNDMTSIWSTEYLNFKLMAPNGLAESDTLIAYFYTSNNSDWDYSCYLEITDFQDISGAGEGHWVQFSLPLKDFVPYANPFDTTDVVAVSFEAPIEGSGIASEFYIDHVWIGTPNVRQDLTLWNGAALPNGVEASTSDLTYQTLEGAGYTEGSPAILWENATADYAYLGFDLHGNDWYDYAKSHDLTGSWAADSLKIKVKAPADAGSLFLTIYDWDDDYAYYELAGPWDGTWKEIEIPLADFSDYGDVNKDQIYWIGIETWYAAVTDTVLFDDIWIGNPYIDFTPPPVPSNVQADVSNPGYNIISWDNIDSESGETYDVYGSPTMITDLEAEDVFVVEAGVAEGNSSVHNLYSPLVPTESSFFYAVMATDAGGNVSDGFGKTDAAATNTGNIRPIISLDPISFTADGNLTEWSHIMPFKLNPDEPYSSLYTGEIADSLDYSAYCYVAMDNDNLFVAFDVFDDVFSWTSSNTVEWWEDENIEFYIGLYQNSGKPHTDYGTGAEPDYRIEFRPDMYVLSFGDSSIAEGTANYYFQPLGSADYRVEAKIPFAMLQQEGDSLFVPSEGMTVPFEVFAADADIENGGNESRLQYGDNPALNPWSDGPQSWTFAWVGTEGYFTSIEDENHGVVASYKLGNNYPNPFNPTTTIEYSIAKPGKVELTIYNAIGQKVTTLVNDVRTAGSHKAMFDAKNLASGTYFYQIRSNGFVQVKKMLILK